MNIKLQLSLVNFLQFFIWGAWLLSAGVYMGKTLDFSGVQIGSVYASMGIVAIFMPTLMGIVADKWIKIEKLYGMSHIIVAILMLVLYQTENFLPFYTVFFLINMFYMPTLSLSYSLSYSLLGKYDLDIIKSFPPIRVWGTIGFIIAAWMVDIFEFKFTNNQFLLSAAAALLLGIYSFFLPKTERTSQEASTFKSLVKDAGVLLKNNRIVIFLVFSVLLGSLLQITNIWGVPFLDNFGITHPDSFVVKYSVILMSLSQISETVFILTIPFFYKRFGIKKVFLISIVAWILRFGFFAIGGPEGFGLGFLILSMIIYGLAFDFFNISGSLFMEQESSSGMRSSAQGLFVMATNGFGPIIGGFGSGLIVDALTTNGDVQWTLIWTVFAAIAGLIAIAFLALFKD